MKTELCWQCANDFNASCQKWSCADIIRLEAERDAYRELALRMVEDDNTNIDSVDAEAIRILQTKTKFGPAKS